MEPSEFDTIIRGKLQEETTLHQREMEASKPFVWAAIQSKKTTVVPWYYLAAAAILFFVCFSWIFIQLQEQHQSELQLLSQKLEHLQSKTKEVELVTQKNRQLDLLCSEVEALEEKLTQVSHQPRAMEVPNQVVYRTDTVFITKTEYITEYLSLPEVKEKEEPLFEPEIDANLNATSDLIYPDFNSSTNTTVKKENASVKVKINTFSSN